MDAVTAISFVSKEEIITVYTTLSESRILLEGSGNIGAGYSILQHGPHNQMNGQKHIHTYLKGNQIFSMNIDGSAHDASHGVRIPNRVREYISSKLPQYTIPENGLIESIDYGVAKFMVTEIEKLMVQTRIVDCAGELLND